MDENIIIGLLTVVVIILAVCAFRNYKGTEPFNSGVSAGTAKIGFKYQTNDKDVIDFMNICQPAITSFVNKNKYIAINEITKQIQQFKNMDENTWQQWQTMEFGPGNKCTMEQDLIKEPRFNTLSPAIRQLAIDAAKYCSTRLCTNGKIDKHKVIYLLERVRASM